MKQSDMICSFCGRGEPEVKKFIASPNGNAFICEECIEICKSIVTNNETKINIESKKLLTPKQIKAHLDDYIIGQDEAKKVLSVAVYNHYKKVNHNLNIKSKTKIELDKSNILLVGPTGCGKTLLAKTLAKILEVPFAMCDATTLTEAGYVGDDVESVLSKLLASSGGDIKKAQMGIVYIDEIDKIAKKSENRNLPKDPSGEGVQQALLKIIEGTNANVPLQTTRKTPYQESVSLDTTNILFICGGAFVGLDKIVDERSKNHNLGFSKKLDTDKSLQAIMPQDLIKFGLIPEFVGRLPVVSKLQKLTNQDLQDILTKPKNSIIKQFQEILYIDGVNFVASDSAIEEIAREASNLADGARGLRTILENNLLDAMYNLPASDIKTCTLDACDKKLLIRYDDAILKNGNLQDKIKVQKDKTISVNSN